MTTEKSNLIAATKLHNRAIALVSSGFRHEALPIITDALEMGLAASGRALFTLLSADREMRERAARVAASTALMDPLRFKFVNDALRRRIPHAAARTSRSTTPQGNS